MCDRFHLLYWTEAMQIPRLRCPDPNVQRTVHVNKGGE